MFLSSLFTKKDQEASHHARREHELNRSLAIATSNASWEEAEALVKQGAVSGTLYVGHTALFNAARANRVDLLKALAPSATWPKQESNPEDPALLQAWSNAENDNQNALMAACSNGSLDAVGILLAAAPPEILLERDVHGASCLDFAVFSGNVDLVQELLVSSLAGQSFGHNDRWQAAAVAAALNNSAMLDFFENNPLPPPGDGEWDSCESLAVCSLSRTCKVFSEHGEAHLHKMSAYIDDWDIYEPALNIAIDELTLDACEKPNVEAIAQAIRMDRSQNAPPLAEDWAAKAFSAAVRARCEDTCSSLLATAPELASASIKGFSALMLASSAGLLSVCQALAPISNCSAKDESGESALSMSLWGIANSDDYESDQKAEVFSFLASLADEAQWLREEDALWKVLICDHPRHWSDDDVLMAARSAAKRSSPVCLSKALAMAIAEDKPLLVELLYPQTNSANNASAVLAEFVRRCSRNPAMATLVATAAATLTDVEALTAASPEPVASAKASSRRL